MNELVLSRLGHTWILDLDGTVVKHNGYKLDGKDSLLDGAKQFLDNISNKDMIIFLTSRSDTYKDETISFLNDNHIRFDYIIFNAPYGERILINDEKPSGLKTGIAINTLRDSWCNIKIMEDSTK